MEKLSILPSFVTTVFKSLPLSFRNRHRLVFMWYLLLSAVDTSDHKIKQLASKGPKHVGEYHFRRLLTASYWSLKLVLTWLSEEVMKRLDKPSDGVLYLVADGSKKEKRSKKTPFYQKGKIRINHGWFWGFRFVVLMVQWGNYRLPVDFEILYAKKDKRYKPENALFREMLQRFQPPKWGKRVIVLADSGFASKDNMKSIENINKPSIHKHGITWGYVIALPKTWKLADGQSLKNVAKHTRRSCYKKCRIPSLTGKSSKTYWTFAKKASLRHVGDVTIVLSKKRRNEGPKNIKLIVTNLPELSTREVLNIYQRRFMIECLFRELKTGMGLGKQQVSKNEKRVYNSVGMAALSYLLILRLEHKTIEEGKPWSIVKLREALRMRVFRHQVEHEHKLIEEKFKKAA